MEMDSKLKMLVVFIHRFYIQHERPPRDLMPDKRVKHRFRFNSLFLQRGRKLKSRRRKFYKIKVAERVEI